MCAYVRVVIHRYTFSSMLGKRPTWEVIFYCSPTSFWRQLQLTNRANCLAGKPWGSLCLVLLVLASQPWVCKCVPSGHAFYVSARNSTCTANTTSNLPNAFKFNTLEGIHSMSIIGCHCNWTQDWVPLSPLDLELTQNAKLPITESFLLVDCPHVTAPQRHLNTLISHEFLRLKLYIKNQGWRSDVVLIMPPCVKSFIKKRTHWHRQEETSLKRKASILKQH